MVHVEAVDGVDAQLRDLLSIVGAETGRGGENGNVHVAQLLYVVNHLVRLKLQWLVLVALTAHHARDLEIGSRFQCLYREFSNVAVANDGRSYLFHALFVLSLFYVNVFLLAKVVFYLVKSNIAPAFLWNSNILKVKIHSPSKDS